MKEKLLYICKFNPFSYFGGATIRNRLILKLLCSKYDVHIACFSTKSPDLISSNNNIHCVKYNYNILQGIAKNKSLYVARFYSKSMVKIIQELTHANDFVIIYISELAMFQYVRHCSNASKYILDSHNIESKILEEGRKYQSFFKKIIFGIEYHLLFSFERKAIKQSQLNIFVSEKDREYSDKFFNSNRKSIMIPNCYPKINSINPIMQDKDLESCDFRRFAIIATLDWHANKISIDWFIKNIWENHANLHKTDQLYLIGKKHKKRSKFKGRNIVCYFNPEDVGSILESVDVCIAPLLYGSGSRLRILEYFSYKKPVITTSKAASGLDIEQNIHFLKFENKDEFRIAVEKLYDTSFRNKLISNSYSLLRSKYDIELYRDTLLKSIQ